MTTSYLIFMVFMTGAWVAMVTAWIMTVRFFIRHKQPEQSSLNPLNGIVLWRRLFTAGAFGEDAEAKRQRITRGYLLAVGLFATAVLVFLVLPAVPR